MKYQLFLTCALLALFYTGCTSSNQTISNDYDKTAYRNRKIMLIAPPKDSISTDIADDVEDDFPEDKREARLVLKKAFSKHLVGYLRANSKYTIPELMIGFPDKEDTILTDQKRLKFSFPSESPRYMKLFAVPGKEMIAANGYPADIVIFITAMNFSRNSTLGTMHFTPGQTISTPTGSFTIPGMMVGGGGYSALYGNCDFIIYDYQKNDWLVYGRAFGKSSITFNMTRQDWKSVFDDLCKGILEKSPFVK